MFALRRFGRLVSDNGQMVLKNAATFSRTSTTKWNRQVFTTQHACINSTAICTKKTEKYVKKSREVDDDDDDDDEEDKTTLKEIEKDGTVKDYKVQDLTVDSLRVDKLIRKFFNATSSQAQEMYMSGKVRLNGQRITTKAEPVTEGDVLELQLGVNADNKDYIDVNRVEIYSTIYLEKDGKYRIRVKRWNRLIVDDFDSSKKV